MYATVTEIACKSSTDLEQAVGKLEGQRLPGFMALYVVRTGEQDAGAGPPGAAHRIARFRPLRRMAGEIVLPR